MGDLAEKIDLAKSCHAHFNDEDLCLFIETRQRQRHAQLVVLIFFCDDDLMRLARDLREQILGAGLSLAAGDGDHWSVKTAAAPFAQLLDKRLTIFCRHAADALA